LIFSPIKLVDYRRKREPINRIAIPRTANWREIEGSEFALQFVRPGGPGPFIHHLNCGNDSSLDINGGITLFARFKQNTISPTNYLITKHGIFGGDELSSYGMDCFNIGGKYFRFWVFDGSLVRNALFTASELNDTENFHDVVVTHDNSNAILYIDGKYSETVSLAYTPQISTGDLLIGYLGRVEEDTAFNGLMSRAGIYNRVLSDSQSINLSRQMANGEEIDFFGLVFWLRFQEGFGVTNGTIIRDWSNEQNHGSMQNFNVPPSNPWIYTGVI
jgi:hypothetical protein